MSAAIDDQEVGSLIPHPEAVEVMADGHLALSCRAYVLVTRHGEGSPVESRGYHHFVWRRIGGDSGQIQVDAAVT